jgi:hypothetical protein
MNTLLRPLALLALLTTLAACAGSAPPLTMAIGEICKQRSGTLVHAEGYLSLPPSALSCADGQCRLGFSDGSSGVAVALATSATPGLGTLTMPPLDYTLADLHVTLADGSSADRATRVRISGPVRTAPKTCYLEVYTTERP